MTAGSSRQDDRKKPPAAKKKNRRSLLRRFLGVSPFVKHNLDTLPKKQKHFQKK